MGTYRQFEIYFVVLENVYKEFAVTSVNKRGNRILLCPLGYTYSQHVSSQNGTWWRCNTTIYGESGKPKRCGQRIRTKTTPTGYEMIEIVKRHNHEARSSPFHDVPRQISLERY